MSSVRLLPALDSDSMAEANREHLAIGRTPALRMAHETLAWCKAGSYTTRTRKQVDIGHMLARAVSAKRSIAPDGDLPRPPAELYDEMTIQVSNETTTTAARRLLGSCKRVTALNFANGIVPGGGFLNGARAQEEVLCRMSALYPTLVDDPMYAHHQKQGGTASSSWAILSPNVPILRGENGAPLEQPWLLAFISCAAPVAADLEPDVARALLRERIDRVLTIARAYGNDGLVLGAWGCGAFGNDASATAHDFRDALLGPFAGAFKEVVFAIADWSSKRRYLAPFRAVLSAHE